MTFQHNDKSFAKKRRYLRRNQTLPEYKLWEKLRSKQLLKFKFYRQFSIEAYIVDFYCHSKKLIIELDGQYHGDEKIIKHDKKRDDFFKAKEYKVLRIQNKEVLNNIDAVLEVITEKLKTNSPDPS
jgi:very-short-patch-repair endonuclease